MEDNQATAGRAGRLLVFTGDGKGKTTAALGMALRAAGHGQRVYVIQFLKADATTGELAALARLPGVEVLQKGMGFVPCRRGGLYEEHRETARRALELGREALASGRYGLVIFDEICGALATGLIDEGEVIEAIGAAAADYCLVLTGRAAPPGIVALADTVTEMRCVKHAYRAGIAAQRGVEY